MAKMCGIFKYNVDMPSKIVPFYPNTYVFGTFSSWPQMVLYHTKGRVQNKCKNLAFDHNWGVM